MEQTYDMIRRTITDSTSDHIQSPEDGSPYLNPVSSDYRRSGVFSGLNNEYFWSLFSKDVSPL